MIVNVEKIALASLTMYKIVIMNPMKIVKVP